MDAIERVRKTIEHEEPDRVPSFEWSIDNVEICQYYGENYHLETTVSMQEFLYNMVFGNIKSYNRIMKRKSRSFYLSKTSLKSIGRLYKKIGIDLCPNTIGFFPVTYSTTGYIDEFGRKFEYNTNPADGMTIRSYLGGIYENFEDYQQFNQPDPDHFLRKKLYHVGKQIEKDYDRDLIFLSCIPGIMKANLEGFGLENFTKLLSHPSKAQRVFDDRGKFAFELTKRILDWGEELGLIIYENYGNENGLFMNLENYQKYVFPWLHRICDLAHNRGLKVFLHSRGDILTLLPDIINSGVDALHPIEPNIANPNYNIFKLNEKYKNDLCFVGNVSQQDLSDMIPTDIQTYVKKLIKRIGPNGGFILSSGNSINQTAKLENFLAMRDALLKFGNYPLG